MRSRLWPWVWLWLAGLGPTETAPSPEKAKTSAPEPESVLFIDRPDFFDYPNSDHASLLAVSQFIGEKPAIFVDPGSSADFFHYILVTALVLTFLFLLLQFCTHM
ncbi:fertilization-influencing membrane protein [Orycteropus afer afer]|uniref:Fertilization-influencing membrane protein n=1 Tax=Orycteropus afer afer TaxID=1230840 RepID=A0A8B7AKF1_ORYAF|nr:fertilization-influencing membrane protein [Orycteropus afer afer]